MTVINLEKINKLIDVARNVADHNDDHRAIQYLENLRNSIAKEGDFEKQIMFVCLYASEKGFVNYRELNKEELIEFVVNGAPNRSGFYLDQINKKLTANGDRVIISHNELGDVAIFIVEERYDNE